jgi:hypothetical protein
MITVFSTVTLTYSTILDDEGFLWGFQIDEEYAMGAVQTQSALRNPF